MRPLIGITVGSAAGQAGPRHGYWLGRAYAGAVAGAGGLAAALPPHPTDGMPPLGAAPEAAEWLERLDGLLLSGGGDVDPAHFGQRPSPRLGAVDRERDAWELALARGALAAGLPVLGICRGAQVLNVAAGGTLIQDIGEVNPDALPHAQEGPRWESSHAVRLAAGTRLDAVLASAAGGPEGVLRVNSFHHQAVDRVGAGFVVAAVAPDGVVEAIERPEHPFAVGVQWHPEEMWERDDAARRLFVAFVAAARQRAARRP